MKRRMSRIPSLLVLASLLFSLFVLTAAFAQASDTSHLSGSYKVIHKTDLGPQTRIRLQLRLANHGERDLLIQRLTLWGSSHPAKSATEACSIVVHTGAFASTTQEFTIPRSEYSQWRREKHVRMLIAVESPGGRKAIEEVRLDRMSGGKAN
jgi:hypothetical protein